MTLSRLSFFSSLSFIFGIFFSSFFNFPIFVINFFLFISFFFFILGFFRTRFFVFSIFLLIFIFGILHYWEFYSKIERNYFTNFFDKKIKLIGKISQEPQIKEKFSIYVLKIDGLKEKVLILAPNLPQYSFGDKLEVVGILQKPQNLSGFDWQGFLAKEGIFAQMAFPQIKLIKENSGNFLLRLLFSFKRKFQEGVREFISPPQAGILEALLFGDESQIPTSFKEKLNITGIRHITAVSGLNLSILTFLILSGILALGFSRSLAIFLSLFLIFIYLLMIGCPSSGVRAAIMASLALLAQHIGRLSSGQRPIVFSAALMLFHNPLLLKYDLGFQLSFLGILGICYWQEFFQHVFSKIPDFKFFPLKTTLSTTLSAQIFTFPLLIYNFGQMPLYSLIANILIVPFLGPFTVFFFIFGLTIFFSKILAFIISFLVWFFLNYIVFIVEIFSNLPFSYLIIKISFPFLIFLYIFLIFITHLVNQKMQFKFLNF